MDQEQLKQRRDEIEANMKKLTEQYNAQMNFWAGQKNLLDELLAPPQELPVEQP